MISNVESAVSEYPRKRSPAETHKAVQTPVIIEKSMKPEEDPWLKQAHEHAEQLDREIRKLSYLSDPIRANLPIITKYQDFWNQAKQITTLFRELKPLARDDRELLWNRFNELCAEVKVKQQSEYGTLESLSKGHYDQIMKLAEQAVLPEGAPPPDIRELLDRGQALKTAGDLLGRYKHEMLAKHKKASFDRIQGIRREHDAAWENVNPEKQRLPAGSEAGIRKNLEANRERYRKAAGALENFRIGAANLRVFIDSCREPEKAAKANAQLAETQARIKDIAEGMHKLEKWIEEDERALGVE